MDVCKKRIDVPLSIDHRISKEDFTRKERLFVTSVHSTILN
jgi:hypothetical protein